MRLIYLRDTFDANTIEFKHTAKPNNTTKYFFYQKGQNTFLYYIGSFDCKLFVRFNHNFRTKNVSEKVTINADKEERNKSVNARHLLLRCLTFHKSENK